MGCGSSGNGALPPQTPGQPSPEPGEKRVAPATGPKRPPIAKKGKWTNLHEAAEAGNAREIKYQLDKVHVDQGDENCWTSLLEACEKGHVKAVEALIEGRADPNMADKDCWTPLMAAAEKGSVAVAEILLNAGASAEFQNPKGWTCTMEAAEKGFIQFIKLLVQRGAPLNITDEKGFTAFMAACEGGNIECVKHLWIHGSDHNMESDYDPEGWGALDEAKYRGHTHIVQFMQPIVDAEKNLKMMIDTDDWRPEEALQYLERAQQVWCLRGIVERATVRMSEVLQQHVINRASPDREQCFDFLLHHDVRIFRVLKGEEPNPVVGNAAVQESGNNPTIVNPCAVNPALKDAVREMCQVRLSQATQGDSVAQIKWAMASAVKSGASRELAQEMESAKSRYKGLVKVPDGWDLEAMAEALTSEGTMFTKKAVQDPSVVEQMQRLMDATLRKKYTRDRQGGKVPDRLVLERVVMVQNEKNFSAYQMKLNNLPSPGGVAPLPQFLTTGKYPCLPLLNAGASETWLFHGTSEAAAEAIASSDFRLNLAGTNAGSLYGSGIYFGDSCSKSDEYCAANKDGVRCLILCRVSLGRILYNDEVNPDPQKLTRQCLCGEYDSILGDREKCRGTYKEFIVFDNDQAYPEFLLFYRRWYNTQESG